MREKKSGTDNTHTTARHCNYDPVKIPKVSHNYLKLIVKQFDTHTRTF